jgi:hypothetical protein
MADIIDKGSDTAEFFLGMALRNRQHGAIIESTGSCLSCSEALAGGHRWCSVECRDDWQAEQKRRERR